MRLWHIKEIIKDEQGNPRLEYNGDIRGMLWFSHQKKNIFVNRDLNGALNIRNFLIMGKSRPEIFKRTCVFPREKNSDKKLLIKVESEDMIQKRIDRIKMCKEYKEYLEARKKGEISEEEQNEKNRDPQKKKPRCFKYPYKIIQAK